MNKLTLKKNKSPNLKIPSFVVDGELHNKLNQFELTKLLNKHNFTLILGKAGQGKSSLEIGFLQTPSLFKSVFHNIILFCPINSRQSLKNDFWGKNLPDDQIYDELTYETLQQAYDVAQENASEGFKTLIIMDDVQKYLKDNDIQKLLLHMVNNRRHAQLSIHLLCQNYYTIPKQVRMALTNLFIFKVSKPELSNIFNEQVEIPNEIFNNILQMSYKNKHDFIFIDTNTKKIFLNWDEIIIHDL